MISNRTLIKTATQSGVTSSPVKPISFSHPPTATFMDQDTGLAATAASRQRIWILGQFQNQRAIGLLTVRLNTMPFPEGQAQHNIRHGGGLDD